MPHLLVSRSYIHNFLEKASPIASKRLPLVLSAQLIIAETLFALVYGFLWESRWPAPLEWAGAGLLIAGVLIGVGVFSRAPEAVLPDRKK